MPRYFTHYWNNSTWEQIQEDEGEILGHAAGNLFRARGVQPGDFVYVVTVKRGRLLVAARIEVGQVVSKDQVANLLGSDHLWDAEDPIIGVPGVGVPMRSDRLVPVEVTEQIRCLAGGEP